MSVRQTSLALLLLHAGAIAVAWHFGWLAGFLTLAVLHLSLTALTLWPGSTPFCAAIQSFPVTGRQIFLTIDDGPCQDTTAFLDLLDHYQAKATFFLIGQRAAAHPAAVQSMTDRGHAVENHTWSHPATTFWAYPPARQRQEIQRTSALLRQLTGHPPRWFRAPAGFRNPWAGPILRESALTYLGWTARGFDTRETNADKIIARLRPAFRPGAILLIHQGHPHSLIVLEKLLQSLQSENLICAPLPQEWKKG